MLPQFPPQLLFRRDVPDKEAEDDTKENGIQYGFVVLRPIRRQEVQKARQQRRNQQRRQEQEPDISQAAVKAEDNERQIGQLPLPPVDKRPAQQHRDQEEDNLSAPHVKVHRGPLLNVGDVQLLAVGQIEGIINQLPAVGVDEQGSNRRQPDLDQGRQLLSRPFPRLDASPLASHQPCRSHNPEDQYPQKPRPVRIDPKQKKYWQDPERPGESVPVAPKQDHQYLEVNISQQNRPRTEGNAHQQNAKKSSEEGAFHVSACAAKPKEKPDHDRTHHREKNHPDPSQSEGSPGQEIWDYSEPLVIDPGVTRDREGDHVRLRSLACSR